MKSVYICSPLSGDLEVNKRKANEYCAYAAQQRIIPLTIFTQSLDDTVPSQRQQGIKESRHSNALPFGSGNQQRSAGNSYPANRAAN